MDTGTKRKIEKKLKSKVSTHFSLAEQYLLTQEGMMVRLEKNSILKKRTAKITAHLKKLTAPR